jgi:CRISPR/Cas system endoribonuclease Cas6 (RAMP superfamily)
VPRRLFGSYGNVTYTQVSDGGRPLYSTGSSPIVLKGGVRYRADMVVVHESHDFLNKFIVNSEVKCSGPYGEYVLFLDEVEVRDMRSLSMDLSRVFKIVFLTPTILTVKLMTPPSLASKVSRLPELHKLIPQPSFIFSHLLKLWNSYASPEERIPRPAYNEWAHYNLGRLADITLTELDYKVWPETVPIGRDRKGTLRKARGFRGWVIYKSIAPKNLHNTYAKLLTLATLTGIGRSRGIGLGQIQVINNPNAGNFL